MKLSKIIANVTIYLAICFAIFNVWYFIESIPNMKSECESVSKGIDYSLLEFALVVGITPIAISLTLGMSWVAEKILPFLKDNSSKKTKWFWIIVCIVFISVFSLSCYVQYQYCGQISTIEFIKYYV